MKKMLVIIFILVIGTNPLLVLAKEDINSDFLVKEKDSIESIKYLTFIDSFASSQYIKTFKITNKTKNTLIINRIETKEGYDNEKAYKNLRTPYSQFIFESFIVCTLGLGIPIIIYGLEAPFIPLNNLAIREELLSHKKFQRGTYKLRSNKSIILIIAPKKWNPELEDELIMYYKKLRPSSEVETFRYQFKYPATNQIKNY